MKTQIENYIYLTVEPDRCGFALPEFPDDIFELARIHAAFCRRIVARMAKGFISRKRAISKRLFSHEKRKVKGFNKASGRAVS